MSVQRSIEIEATPEEVWPFLTDPERILEWYSPLQRLEYTTEQQGGVGATFYFEHASPMGTLKLNCVVTEWVENEVFAFEMTSGNLIKGYAERRTVEAIPLGSRFTFTEEVDLPFGAIGRLIQPLAERSSGTTVERILAKLKSIVEA
jgi:uncharacterized protein YndB with AHSA1/START domain